MSFAFGALISVLMVVATVAVYYEILRIVWVKLPKIHIKPRLRIIAVALAVFAGHTVAVWIYGSFYWIASNYMDIGSLEYQNGGVVKDFFTCIYFSASSYSSLGFGDVIPTGEIRLITGVEVLNGLVLIGWSVSFTYLAMEKFWDQHKKPTS